MITYLDEMAWSCWNNGNSLEFTEEIKSRSDIEVAIESYEIKVVDGYLIFLDENNLTKRASVYLVNNILLSLIDNPSELFTQLYEVLCKETSDKDNLAGIALASIQNQNLADVFELAILAIPNYNSIFDIIHILERAIPLFNRINVESLFSFSKATFAELQNDSMGATIYDGLILWLVHNDATAREIIAKFTNSPERETSVLYRCALIVISRVDLKEAVDLALHSVKSGDSLISSQAIEALGFFKFNFPECSEEFYIALNLVSEEVRKESLLFISASNSLWRLVQQNLQEYKHLQALIATNNLEGYYSLSRFLLINVASCFDKPWFAELLYAFKVVEPKYKGILDNLDVVISSIIKNKEQKEVGVIFLEQWLMNRTLSELKEENFGVLFNSTFYEIIRSDLLSSLFTKWMSHESKELANGAFQLIQCFENSRGKELSYDINLIDQMDSPDIVLLVKRTIGYVFEEGILHSLIWSLTNTNDAKNRTLSIVHEVFSNHLGYDYPKITVDFIELKLQDKNLSKDIKEICEAIILYVNSYLKDLKDLPQLKELKPAYTKVRQFEKERQKQMQVASEKAQENSIFSQLATKVTLKAGRSSFSLNDNNYSEKTHLSSHSFSINLPRSEIIDPVGSDRSRMLFRSSVKATS